MKEAKSEEDLTRKDSMEIVNELKQVFVFLKIINCKNLRIRFQPLAWAILLTSICNFCVSHVAE